MDSSGLSSIIKGVRGYAMGNKFTRFASAIREKETKFRVL